MLQSKPTSLNIPEYRFAPASPIDETVYGAERPGYGSYDVPTHVIQEWIGFMQRKDITRVCCLLDEEQLGFYKETSLQDEYARQFGEENTLFALIPDHHLCSGDVLNGQILPFLEDSRKNDQKTVVHCAGGQGRTGQILAAWIVRTEAKTPEEALRIVSKLYRDPYEVVKKENASLDDLKDLLAQVALFPQLEGLRSPI